MTRTDRYNDSAENHQGFLAFEHGFLRGTCHMAPREQLVWSLNVGALTSVSGSASCPNAPWRTKGIGGFAPKPRLRQEASSKSRTSSLKDSSLLCLQQAAAMVAKSDSKILILEVGY